MQDFLALTSVTVAAGYLAWRAWMFFASRKQARSCGSSCGGCAKGVNELVPIQLTELHTTKIRQETIP
jgi:hypothetical protein